MQKNSENYEQFVICENNYKPTTEDIKNLSHDLNIYFICNLY